MRNLIEKDIFFAEYEFYFSREKRDFFDSITKELFIFTLIIN